MASRVVRVPLVGVLVSLSVVLWCTPRTLPAQWHPEIGRQWSVADGELRPPSVRGVAFGDLDGDLHVDLVTVGSPTSAAPVRWWRNDGHGVFREPTDLPAAALEHRCCVTIDADRDGDLDVLAVTGYGENYARGGPPQLLSNEGQGRAWTSTLLSRRSILGRKVHRGDIDGDGLPDVLITGVPDYSHVTMLLLLTRGSLGLADRSTTNLPANMPSAESWSHMADFDGDGDLDLLCRANPTPTTLLLNDGNGAFSRAASGAVPQLVRAIGAGDVDRDGDLDLVDPRNLWINPGGSGSWRTVPLPRGGLATVEFADLDNDGLQEMVGVLEDGSLAVFGLSNLSDDSLRWFGPPLLAPRAPAGSSLTPTLGLGDVDGDGYPDLVFAAEETPSNSVRFRTQPPRLLLNDGGRRFVDGSHAALPSWPLTTGAMAAGDLDGDGDVDLVTSQERGFAPVGVGPSVWFNDGRASFEPGGEPGLHGAACVALVDLEGDGDLDVVLGYGWSAWGPVSVADDRVVLNDGSGRFLDVSGFALPRLPARATAALATGDVDGDGDVDLLFGHQDALAGSGAGAPDRLLLNDGAGRFVDGTAGRLPPAADPTVAVVLVDFDADGDLDVVQGNGPHGAALDGVRLLENDGSGRFTDVSANGRVPALARIAALAVADLDADGDPDIALPDADLLNDGRGVFTRRPAGARSGVRGLRAGDLGGDGSHGVVTGHDGEVRAPGWTGWQAEQATVTPFVLADLDGDEDLDLVVGTTPSPGAQVPIGDYGMGVVLNHHRQSFASGLPRVGRRLRIHYRVDAPGSWSVVPLFGTALRAPRLTIPGIHGSLAIAGTPIVGRARSLVGGTSELELFLPADPRLHGLELIQQPLFVSTGSGDRFWLGNVVGGPITL